MLFVFISSNCYAGDGYPRTILHIHSCKEWQPVLNDTVPDVKKTPDIKTDSSVKGTAIKEVPKSKKQAVPVAVPINVNIKPLKVVKPKIIKPVIKLK